MKYIIIKNNKPFDVFWSADLPTDKGGLSRIINFSNYHYTIFSTIKEAEDHITFMKKEAKDKDNINRWEAVCPGVSKKLLKLINSLKIIEG